MDTLTVVKALTFNYTNKHFVWNETIPKENVRDLVKERRIHNGDQSHITAIIFSITHNFTVKYITLSRMELKWARHAELQSTKTFHTLNQWRIPWCVCACMVGVCLREREIPFYAYFLCVFPCTIFEYDPCKSQIMSIHSLLLHLVICFFSRDKIEM